MFNVRLLQKDRKCSLHHREAKVYAASLAFSSKPVTGHCAMLHQVHVPSGFNMPAMDHKAERNSLHINTIGVRWSSGQHAELSKERWGVKSHQGRNLLRDFCTP